MDEINKLQLEELLQSAPGGLVKLAIDDLLTILFASDAFFSLVKNVSDKETTQAPQLLLRLVYSADVIYVTQQLAAQKHRKDNMLSFNFRTLQPDGSFRWIMIAGSRMQEVHQSGTKSVPIYACLASDITDYMVQYKKLEQSVDYNRAITELSKDLYFEYEIATDTLSFTQIFREVFGREPVLTGFRKRLDKTKLIHSDELPAVVGIYNSMMSGRKQARFELRLIPKDGIPCWYICYASIIFGDNRNPYKVVGKLSTRNSVDQKPEEASFTPAMDQLTNVCTKESTEIMMKGVMKKQTPDSLSAVMIVDIRNYKNINEIRKSISGEDLLTTLAKILKGHFRTTDIIGRIGASAFAVYIKDLPTDNMAYEKAEQLCKALENLYAYEHTKNAIIVSIGIALQKGEQEFQTMMANANAALVMAKKVPASSFEVFSGAISS